MKERFNKNIPNYTYTNSNQTSKRRREIRNFGILFLSIILFLSATGLVQAATFTVTKTADTNDGVCDVDCSLREAIESANTTAPDDIINFVPEISRIILTNEIVIENNGALTIIGTGANVLTIDGGSGSNRIFTSNGATVTINGLSLTGGDGGGFSSFGFGGAILANLGNLTLDSVYVFGNSAYGRQGGAILTQDGTNMVIRNSTFFDNSARTCGAVSMSGASYISNTTFSSNRAENQGGGVCVINAQNNIIFRNVTIVNNTASTGGGIFLNSESQNAVLNLGNSIVAQNSAPNKPDIFISSSVGQTSLFTSAGNNLIGDSIGDSTDTGEAIAYQITDILDTSPQIGLLDINGGTTPTHFLQFTSPAIDSGNNTLAVDPSTGVPLPSAQNGFSRIIDGNDDGTATVDIGAFELPLCFYSINPINQYFQPIGGNGSIDMTVQEGCMWTAQSDVPWVSITQGNSGSGNGTVLFSVEPTTETRTGTISLAGRILTINQGSFTVSNLNDSGAGSLRQAIIDANNIPLDNTINFQNGLSGIIILTSGELLINSSITINGPGADVISVSGNYISRVFQITANSNVNINNLSIVNGKSIGQIIGAGVLNAGELIISDSKIRGNGTAVSPNHSGGSGIGIANTGTMTLLNSTVSNNSGGVGLTSPDGGAGISNSGNLEIINSTISSNTARYGAGILNSGIASITNSTIHGNIAGGNAGNAGAIFSSNSISLIR